MEKGKRLETVDGEIPLPEAMIQHIQSFLSWKDAARTTVLSKPWYSAWLTRPALLFDQTHLKNGDPKSSNIEFVETATKTMRRYKDLNLKIERFTLRTHSCSRGIELFANKLISDAIKIGATDLNLQLRSPKLLLPPEVLGSGNLLRLSVSGRRINGKVNCWRLKSLTLDGVHVESDDMFRDLISCCKSIEELSISNCDNLMNSGTKKSRKLMLTPVNLCEHHKLRRLFLEMVGVDSLFFSNLESRFPFLKDLSIVRCHGYRIIQIGSTSLERVSFVQLNQLTAELDVPNIRKFSYSGMCIPSLCIEGTTSREWESDISLSCRRPPTSSWFKRLREFLTKLSTSKISLSLDPPPSMTMNFDEVDEEEHYEAPAVVEDLRIEACDSNSCHDLIPLFWVCRPKFISHSWVPDGRKDMRASDLTLDYFCKILQQAMGPNCFIPCRNQYYLKEVKVEVYEENLKEWQPLPLALKNPAGASTILANHQKIRFQLKWMG